jgi:hypothetical protein
MMQAALLVGVNEMENRKQLLRVEQVKGSFTPKPLTKPCVSPFNSQGAYYTVDVA